MTQKAARSKWLGAALGWPRLTLAAALLALAAAWVAATRSTHADDLARLEALRSRIGTQLRARAQLAERQNEARPEWDEGSRLATTAHGYVELIRGRLTPEAAQTWLDRAWESADLAFAYEAAALRTHVRSGIEPDVRGWGTSKPVRLGTFSMERGIEAYSTATALGALSELSRLLIERKDERGRTLHGKLVPIAEYWLRARRFAAPGGPAFDKVAASDPEVRRHIVHNTDALMGRALLTLSQSAALAKEPEQAGRYAGFARSVLRQLEHNVIRRISSRDGVRAANWHYELVLQEGVWEPGRIEDTNHASYLLDFLDAARDARLDPQARWLTRKLLDRLGASFSNVVVRAPDGSVATELYIEETLPSSETQGKLRAREFAFAPSEVYAKAVVSLWRELEGERRTLDLGLSLRTSWGWSRALRRRPDLLVILGEQLAALGERDQSRNLFLAQAVFFREAGAVRGMTRRHDRKSTRAPVPAD